MVWVKLSDDIFDNTLEGIGKDAQLLYIAALCDSARLLTDGTVSPHRLELLQVLIGVDAGAVNELLEAGLWHGPNGSGVFSIDDWKVPIRSAAGVHRDRVAARQRQRRQRDEQSAGRKPGGKKRAEPRR